MAPLAAQSCVVDQRICAFARAIIDMAALKEENIFETHVSLHMGHLTLLLARINVPSENSY